jgi:hypothetical protein
MGEHSLIQQITGHWKDSTRKQSQASQEELQTRGSWISRYEFHVEYYLGETNIFPKFMVRNCLD